MDRVRSPEDDVLDREDRELLRDALARLPEAHREALVLYYLEGQSIARIADVLQIRDVVVKKRLSRGRKALRDSFVRVEAALTRVRPPAAVPATILAALTMLGSRKAVAAPSSIGKVIGIMSLSKKLAVAGIATLVLATGATWLGMRARGDASARGESNATPKAAGHDRAHEGGMPDQDRVAVRRMQDLARRATLLEQIRRAAQQHSRPSASPAAATSAGTAPAAGEELDTEWVKKALVEIVPLIEDCFKQGLERKPKLAACAPRSPGQANDPDFALDCQVFVSMTIEGEPDVGGLVTNTAIDMTQSNVNDPDAVECIKQTIYSLEIGAPPQGGAAEASFQIKIGMDAPESSPG